MKRSVRELIAQYSLNLVPVVHESANLEKALIALEKFQSDALLVMGSGNIVGLFSEKDFARISLIRKGERVLEIPITEAMSTKIAWVTPDYRLDECMAVMVNRGVRHLPVVENDKPIALLSIIHIMEAGIEDRDFLIGELVRYVSGSIFDGPNNNAHIMRRENNSTGLRALG